MAIESQKPHINKREKVTPPVVDKASQSALPEQVELESTYQDHSSAAQAATLQRLPASQAQRYAVQIGKKQGNQHLQRVISRQPQRSKASSPVSLQLKLTVGAVGDQYEQEADVVAEKVMKMPAPATPPSGNGDDDESAAGISGSIGSISRVSRSSGSSDAGGEVSPEVQGKIENLGGGKPLPEGEREFFESRMNADFSGVRIHSGQNANETSQAINARAFTTGSNIAFNQGEYQPGSPNGRRLLAHELTHVVQQGGAGEVQRTPLADAAVEAPVAPAAAEKDAAGAAPEQKSAPVKEPSKQPQAATESAKAGNAPPAPKPQKSIESAPLADPVAAGSTSQEKAPASPQDDPEFNAVVGQSEQFGEKEKIHDPAEQKSDEAQAAAEMQPSEKDGLAQNGQASEIEAAAETQAEAADGETIPGFDKEAFKTAIRGELKANTPSDPKAFEEFEKTNELDQAEAVVSGQIDGAKESAEGDVDDKLEEAPDAAAVIEKEVTPLAPDEIGDLGELPEAERATPKDKTSAEVEEPLQEHSKELDQKLDDNNITEEQLEKSNEPTFIAGLGAKREAQSNAETAGPAYRSQESGVLTGAKSQAQSMMQQRTAEVHSERGTKFGEVDASQGAEKEVDEAKRREIGDKIGTIYETTKTEVTTILEQMGSDVDSEFENGASTAKDNFIREVNTKTQAYKDDRYNKGALKEGELDEVAEGVWNRFVDIPGMPAEYTKIYSDCRDAYVDEMELVLDRVADIVGLALLNAKNRIAEGRQEIQEFVDSQPQELRAIAEEASAEIQTKFDGLEQQVEEKKNAIIADLKTQYEQNLAEVDQYIAEMKEKDKSLLLAGLEALGVPVSEILEMRDMLLGILSEAGDAIEKILDDPMAFLENLLNGVMQGFENFLGNIWEHLQAGFISWLTGTLTEGGVNLPETWDLQGIFGLVLDILGISLDKIGDRVEELVGFDLVGMISQIMELVTIFQDEGLAGLAKYGLAQLIGEDGVAVLEEVMAIINAIKNGDLGAIWEIIQGHLADLKEMVFDQIKTFIVEKVITAGVTTLISMFNPASAFIKACMTIYDVIMYIMDNGKQIMTLVQSVVSSVSAIASGNIGVAAEAVEGALANGIPVAIGFIASILNMGDISSKVQQTLEDVRSFVNDALDAVFKFGPVQAIGDIIKKVVGKISDFAQNGLKNAKKMVGLGGDEEEEKEEEEDNPKVKSGLKTLYSEESALANDGSISKEDAQSIAQKVKSQHPVFASITPIEGADSWNYDYTVQMKSVKGKKLKDGSDLPLKAGDVVSLAYKGNGSRRHVKVVDIKETEVVFGYTCKTLQGKKETKSKEWVKQEKGNGWKFTDGEEDLYKPKIIDIVYSGNTRTITYEYENENEDTPMKFTVVQNLEDYMTTSVKGQNLSMQSGRKKTETPDGHQANQGWNRSHLVANWFGGSGYRESLNLINTSADYNQKMLSVERQITELFEHYEADSFNMEVSVTWGEFIEDRADAESENQIADRVKAQVEEGQKSSAEERTKAFIRENRKNKNITPKRCKSITYWVSFKDNNGQEIVPFEVSIAVPDEKFKIE